MVVLPQQSSQTSQTPQSVWAPAAAAPQPPPVILQDTEPRTEPRKKEKGELKDYNKHWLIQEAEQRRISEAKQKQNLNIMQSQIDIETRENINNNNSGSEIHNSFGDMRTHNVSDNIYANVDSSSSNLNHCVGAGAGPQVPPRQGEPPQDRVLSVSGKKKCSHCKEELGELMADDDEENNVFNLRSRGCHDHRESQTLLPYPLLQMLCVQVINH